MNESVSRDRFELVMAAAQLLERRDLQPADGRWRGRLQKRPADPARAGSGASHPALIQRNSLVSATAFHDQPARGPLCAHAASSAYAFEVIAAVIRTLRAPVERGWSRRKTGAKTMSQNLSLAQSHAWNLAKTLMVSVTLFKSDGGYGVLPSSEFDGDPATILHEYDPYGR